MTPLFPSKKLITALMTMLVCGSFNSSFAFSQTESDNKFEGITLTPSALVQDGATKIELKKVSHGVRKKKAFGLVTVRVYTAEFFAQNPAKLVKTDEVILNSLKEAGPVQLRLTMLRDLKGSDIYKAFNESLAANKIDTGKMSAPLQTVMDEIKSVEKFKEHEVFTITGLWKDAKSHLVVTKPDGTNTSVSGDEDFVKQFMSIWFGEPVDDKLADLKKVLLK